MYTYTNVLWYLNIIGLDVFNRMQNCQRVLPQCIVVTENMCQQPDIGLKTTDRGALQIKDRSPESRPVASECVCVLVARRDRS